MPKVDMTITISVVIAMCAIISPVITTLLNNHHIYKLKKLELKEKSKEDNAFYKRGIYEDYYKITGICITARTTEALGDYGKIYSLALLYFPSSLISEITELNSLISEYEWEKAGITFANLSTKIRNIVQNM